MADRIMLLVPELVLLMGAVICAVAGLAHNSAIRRRVGLVAAAFLAAAGICAVVLHDPQRGAAAGAMMPSIALYVKVMTAGIGILLVLAAGGLVDRRYERAIDTGTDQFDPLRSSNGEFHALALLSLAGLMLICGARDLIWLFLALELASLPTYVMVAISRWSRVGQEAAMKYFFLGALSSALMLYGFALLYAATGTLVLTDMANHLQVAAMAGSVPILAQVGLLLAIFGLCYKLAAAPMHLYAADVYQGAASAVTAFLAFVPKSAGIVALISLLTVVGWEGGLPPMIEMALWVVAVLTMVLGNIGALLQSSAKRMLGYSSIAHSGYLLIGVIAGGTMGLTAVMLYLVIYGISNTAAFSVLASLRNDDGEVDDVDELAGLLRRSPMSAAAMAIACGSLLGLPPLLGFWGKLALLIAGIQAGQLVLVVIAVVTSAISAWYYLRLACAGLLGEPTPRSESVTTVRRWPLAVAVITAAAAVAGPLLLAPLSASAQQAVSDGQPPLMLPSGDPSDPSA